MNVNKMASNDAARWLAAEMAYGQGAGTRRKLMSAEIESKLLKFADTDYADLFHLAYEHLDLDKFAKAAIRERKHLDNVSFISKNAKALLRGDVRHVSPVVYAAIIGGYYAHQTGFDKKILKAVEIEYRVAEHKVMHWWKSRDPKAGHHDQGDSFAFKAPEQRIDPDKPYGGL